MTVHLRGVRVRLAGRRRDPVLRAVDLDVAGGEHLLVTGPSGGGKSTLLRVLTGVVPQSVPGRVDGTVVVAGGDPRTVPVPRTALRVGWVGQDPAASVCLPTVLEEVALPLENRGVPRERILPRVRAALDRVSAGHLLHRRAAELSGGEQQRVAVAAALVADGDLLVLDEPTAMLDPVGADAVLRTVAAVERAVVLVEHRTDGLLPARRVVVDGTLTAVPGPGALPTPAPQRLPGAWSAGEGPPGAAGQAVPAPRPQRRAPTGPPALRARDLVVRRGGRDVVRVGALDAHAGRVTAVIGANGSGKSSLLLALAGVLPLAEGSVRGGPVALAVQRPEHQLLTRSVRGEVLDHLAPGRAEVADALLAELGLAHLAAADPFRLSGGEQRRLVLACARAAERPVVLLDEPTSGLDPALAREVAASLRRVADDGVAVVVVTHDHPLAARVADDVVVLGRREEASPGAPVAIAGAAAPAPGEVLAVGGPALLSDRSLLALAGLLPGGDRQPVAWP